jgi:hypothetical protein
MSSLIAADIGPRLLTTRFTRPRAFPNDDRRLMDMRRSGVVEAVAGDAGPIGLAAKLANSIGRSNTLHKTYAAVDIEALRGADNARLEGRRRANSDGACVCRLIAHVSRVGSFASLSEGWDEARAVSPG